MGSGSEHLPGGTGPGWPGRHWDCVCSSAESHDRDRERGPESVCRAHQRHRGLALLEEFRVRAAETVRRDELVELHAPPRVLSLRQSLDDLNEALDGLEVPAPGATRGLSGADDPERPSGPRVEGAAPDGESLMAATLALEAAQRRLDAAKASVLCSLDRSGATESTAGLATRRWKADRTNGNDATVARELRVAHTAQRFGQIAAELRRGELSADHLLAVAAVCNERIVDALVEQEHRIVRIAKLYPFRRFVRFLRRLAAMLDEDGPEPDCGDRDTAAMARDFESHLHVRLELSGHNAAAAERIINDELDRQWRNARREHREAGVPVPPAGVLRARAVMELLRRGAKANPDSPGPAVEAILPVVVDRGGRPVAVRTSDGTELDDFTSALLMCDAFLRPVVTDGSGTPLRLGRMARLFSGAQRGALMVRDGGCTFPGCDQPASRCDAHHERPWEAGGLTDPDNGCLLCRRHHGLVHAADPWRILHLDVEDLPEGLASAHRSRAASAGVDPASEVRVWRSPSGELFLAQTTADHSGPAPPRRAAA